MGIFDFFRKKDARFFLERAQKELAREQFAYARDDAQEGLGHEDLDPEVEAALREVFTAAVRGICKLNLEEARLALQSGELTRAKECLDTARGHAPDDETRAEVEALTSELRLARTRRREEAEAAEAGRAAEATEGSVDDQFQVYLAALAPDVAEAYARFGETFARAYVHLNSGEAKEALELLNEVEPVNEEAAGLLAFEKARALLAVGDYERALYWLDVTGAIRGAAPIFLSDHPSVAYLRYEALLYLGRREEAAEALRVGLKSQPDSVILKTALADLLMHLERLDEAEPLVEEGLACNRSDPQSHVLKARLLVARGDRDGAIEVLENGIKTCGCNPAALPNPILARALIEIYVEEQRQPRRVDTLLGQLFRAQQGEGDWYDHFLAARYHHWQGNDEKARTFAMEALQRLPDPSDPRRKQVQALLPAEEGTA